MGIPDDAFCIGSFQKDGNGWGDDHGITGGFRDADAGVLPVFIDRVMFSGILEPDVNTLMVPIVWDYADGTWNVNTNWDPETTPSSGASGRPNSRRRFSYVQTGWSRRINVRHLSVTA